MESSISQRIPAERSRSRLELTIRSVVDRSARKSSTAQIVKAVTTLDIDIPTYVIDSLIQKRATLNNEERRSLSAA